MRPLRPADLYDLPYSTADEYTMADPLDIQPLDPCPCECSCAGVVLPGDSECLGCKHGQHIEDE